MSGKCGKTFQMLSFEFVLALKSCEMCSWRSAWGLVQGKMGAQHGRSIEFRWSRLVDWGRNGMLCPFCDTPFEMDNIDECTWISFYYTSLDAYCTLSLLCNCNLFGISFPLLVIYIVPGIVTDNACLRILLPKLVY